MNATPFQRFLSYYVKDTFFSALEAFSSCFFLGAFCESLVDFHDFLAPLGMSSGGTEMLYASLPIT